MLGPIALAGMSGAAIVALFSSLGAIKSVAVVLGVILLFAMLEWPIIGLVLVVLFSTCFQILGGEATTGLPFTLGKVVGVLSMGMWLLKATRDRIPMTFSPQLWALLAYLGGMLLVGVLVHPKTPALENGVLRFIQVMFVYWLMANLAGLGRTHLLIATGALTVGMTSCGIIGAMEAFVPSMAIDINDPSKTLGTIGAIIDSESLDGVTLRRITGGLGDSNWLAPAIVSVLPLNLFWWWLCKSPYTRGLVLIAAGLQCLALLLSYTRAGFVGLAVSILFLVWRRVLSPSLLVWGAIGAVLVGLIWLPPGFLDRIFSVKYLVEGSTPMRKDLTGTALTFALERPILGWGYGQFGVQFVEQLGSTNLSSRVGAWGFELKRAVEEGREYAHNIGAHNLILEVMVEYGLVGLIPFLAFLYLAIYDLRWVERWGNPEQRLLAICIAAGLLAFYTCGIFVHARYLKILWLLTALAAAHRRVTIASIWPEPPRGLSRAPTLGPIARPRTVPPPTGPSLGDAPR